MGVVVIGGGGAGGGGGPKNPNKAEGMTVKQGEQVVAIFATASAAQAYAEMLNREDARVIPLTPDT